MCASVSVTITHGLYGQGCTGGGKVVNWCREHVHLAAFTCKKIAGSTCFFCAASDGRLGGAWEQGWQPVKGGCSVKDLCVRFVGQQPRGTNPAWSVCHDTIWKQWCTVCSNISSKWLNVTVLWWLCCSCFCNSEATVTLLKPSCLLLLGRLGVPRMGWVQSTWKKRDFGKSSPLKSLEVNRITDWRRFAFILCCRDCYELTVCLVCL